MANLSYRVIANYDWRIQAGETTKQTIQTAAVLRSIPLSNEKENRDPVDGTLLQTHFLTDKDHAAQLRDIIRGTYGIYGASQTFVIPPPLTFATFQTNKVGSGFQSTVLVPEQYVLLMACTVNWSTQGFTRPWLCAADRGLGQDPAGNYFMVGGSTGTGQGNNLIIWFENGNTVPGSGHALTIPPGNLKLSINDALVTVDNAYPIELPTSPSNKGFYVTDEGKLLLGFSYENGVESSYAYDQAAQFGTF